MTISDDEDEREDERNLFNSAVFKGGILAFLAPTHASDDQAPADDLDSVDREIKQRQVYGDSVVDLYNKAHQQKVIVSLDLLSQAVLTPKDFSIIESSLSFGNANAEAMISSFAEKNRKIITKHAGSMLASLPNGPIQNAEQIDGLLATYLVDPHKMNQNAKRDRWGYMTTRGQSYATNLTNALFSTRTVPGQLTGDTVHFMMFQHESATKMECFRFGFMDNPLAGLGADDTDPALMMGDPAEVDSEFVKALKLPAEWKMKLPIHAKRLEMVQHVLKKLGPGIKESHAQALFQHVLGELVQSLDRDSFRVVNVDAITANMQVVVQVCTQYLEMQGKATVANSTGHDSTLTIRSDLVVTNVPDEEGKLKQLLGCLYNIEMKAALDKLMRSAIRPKSQLMAESLARSLALTSFNGDCPSVLWSALCDCFCIHILVHFPGEKKAYLSHREIEPGRIVCVVAWLHMMSKQDSITLKDFEAMGFTIGNRFEEEIRNAVTKRASGDKTKGPKGNDDKSKKAKAAGLQKGESKKLCVDRDCDDAEMHIDMVLIEEMEREEARAEMMSTFSSFQNYYRFGDPLPATEAVMRLLENQEKFGEETCHDRLARVGINYNVHNSAEAIKTKETRT